MQLQKQTDFLEANPDFSICFTAFKTNDEIHQKERINRRKAKAYTIEDLIKQNMICAPTNVFISQYFKSIPAWFDNIPYEDWALHLIVLYNSNKGAFCLEDITTVYRVHLNSVHGSLRAANSSLADAYRKDIDFYKKIEDYFFKGDYQSIIESGIERRKNIITELLDERKNPVFAFNEIKRVIDPMESFILVDEGEWEMCGDIDGYRIIPFLENNGEYWGPPADSETAIKEIERQRSKGVRFIVFPWLCFWWLDYYKDMSQYLKLKYDCIINNERLIGFRLK